MTAWADPRPRTSHSEGKNRQASKEAVLRFTRSRSEVGKRAFHDIFKERAAQIARMKEICDAYHAGSGSGGTETANLSTASDIDAGTGAAETQTAQELPLPAITSVSPTTAWADQQVRINGANFGATQGSSFITFSDGGTNWGAPGDAATFTVNSWRNDQITFTVPTPSGAGGQWHVVPGTTATVTVTTADGTSNTANVAISSG